jgi:hypothetical protein
MPVSELQDARDSGNPLRHLQELYAVVVGVALVLAAEDLVDPARDGIPLRGDVLLLFVAFVAVAFPTYHARGRYLDLVYERRGSGIPRGRVFADLVLGTVEFLLLIMLALLVSRPLYFGYTALFLVTAALVRALLVRGLVGEGQDYLTRFERMMLPSGAAAVVAMAAIMFVGQALLDGPGRDDFLRVALLALSLLRAVAYYRAGFDFFFGDVAAGGSEKART